MGLEGLTTRSCRDAERRRMCTEGPSAAPPPGQVQDWTGDGALEHANPTTRLERRLMTQYQSQAVLRRTTLTDPLLLVGVTVDSTFYAQAQQGEPPRLLLTKGLVALAPLSAVEAPDAAQAAVISMVDAVRSWNGPNSPGLLRRNAGR